MGSLELRGVSKVFASGERAVDAVDLTVGEGQLAVIVGPSGCGKSTVLRLVAGLDEPTAGDVSIDGRSLRGVPPQARDVAMTFQSEALYPHLTVRENLAFPLAVTGVGRREIAARLREVASTLHLDDVLDRKPARLSGGQRQRVAVGRSIIRRPRLLLMDEPLSNLDTKLRVEMRSSIVRLQRRLGVTTLFVTHDQVEAMAMADVLAVMRDGRIVQCGPPGEVYARPRDRFVGAFVGCPPLGLLRGFADPAAASGPTVRIGPTTIAWPGLRHAGPVLLGVRPERVVLDPDGELSGSVVGTEDLGRERVVRIALPDGHDGDACVHVVVPSGWSADRWRPVRLRLDRDQVVWFDPTSGERLADDDVPTGAGTGVVAGARHH